MSRALRLLQLATWIVAAILAFIVVSSRSADAPLPATSTLTVTTWSGATTAGELRSLLQQYAEDEQVTFAQEVADFGQRGAVRHLYLVAADPAVPGASWLTQGMVDFGGSITTVVHPLHDADDRSPLGAYDIFGDPAKALALQKFFASQGMDAQVADIGIVGAVPRPVALAAAVILFLTVCMVGAFVVAGTRRYAVGRLHGLSYGNLLLADMRFLGSAWALSGLCTLGGAGAFITLRYGAGGLGLFLATTLVFQLATTLAAVATHALTLAMVMAVDIPLAMKGELPAGALSVTAYGLRIAGVAVALGAMVSTLTLAAEVADRDRTRASFERLDRISAITLGNAYTNEDQALLDQTVGPWLRDADQRGDLVIAAQQVIVGADPGGRPVDTLIVNDRFLADQPVRLAGGGVVDPPDDSVAVIVPESLWDSRSMVLSQLGLDVQLRPAVELSHTFARAAARQQFFTYAPAGGPAESVQVWDTAEAFLIDPVIVVVPSSRGWLSDATYVAIASQGGALFGDPRTVSDAVSDDSRLERFVRGVSPVADKEAAALAEQTAELRLSLFTGLVACLVVAMSGIAAALVHTRRMARRLFVRHLCGWSFIATHRAVLAVEMTLLVGLVAVIPWQLAGQRRELEVWRSVSGSLPVDPPSVSAVQVAAVALLALVTAGGYLLSLTWAHRRVLRGNAGEF